MEKNRYNLMNYVFRWIMLYLTEFLFIFQKLHLYQNHHGNIPSSGVELFVTSIFNWRVSVRGCLAKFLSFYEKCLARATRFFIHFPFNEFSDSIPNTSFFLAEADLWFHFSFIRTNLSFSISGYFVFCTDNPKKWIIWILLAHKHLWA